MNITTLGHFGSPNRFIPHASARRCMGARRIDFLIALYRLSLFIAYRSLDLRRAVGSDLC